ncbi:Non-ribosomal peptide synthetase [Ceratobasidium sp. 428]|nr:Non-ribosomal peptide synthetase [Ceratobasidium sp. 428]
MGVVDPLSEYRFQNLPDLSGLRGPSHSTLSAVRSINFDRDEFAAARHFSADLPALIRVAFARVLLGYIDSPEFLFAEIPSHSNISNSESLSIIRANLTECKTWTDFSRQLERQVRSDAKFSVDAVRRALDLPAQINSLPARFAYGSVQVAQSVDLEGILLLGLSQSDGADISPPSNDSTTLWVVSDATIMSQSALRIYLDQVCAIFLHILKNPSNPPSSIISLPQNLGSAYEESYDSSRAHVAIDWLMRNADTRPNDIAHEIYTTLEESPTVLTFAGLNLGSNRLANWFVQKGVQVEDRVAVCRPRDEHFYIANAALFKCGACYVSIDPELPIERRQFIVRDSGAKFVVTTAQLAPDFGEAALVLENDVIKSELSSHSDENICLAQLDSLAYLLYTSGTTGTPKGCLLNHRGLYWAIDAMCTYPRRVTQPGVDKRLAIASIAFDVHISEICQAWCLGIRLVSAPRYEILADLQENLIKLGITHAGMVPSMIEATLTGPDDLPLKYLVSGGEKISDSLLRKWANHSSLILANFYGPTEATIGCTSRLIKQTDRKENIGHPFPSCRAYVVDASMNIVPRGNPGELVVEGPLVGRGYHNLPETTAKAFMEWPNEGCNAYRTGDLVRMMPDDTIEIMGRIDTQIKLRGVRIESEGVSNVLRKASDRPLDVATLIAKHPDSGSELLISFVAFGDRQVSVAERRSGRVDLATDFPPSLMRSLKAMATRELAVYMRPSHILPLVYLPLSLNMKTDTKLLAEFFRSTPVSTLLAVQNEREGATTPLSTSKRDFDSNQLQVAQIISRLSNTPLDNIRTESNFFECGMDSIRFSALARELRTIWPTSGITATDVLANPTISGILHLCQSSNKPSPIMNSSPCEEFDRKWRSMAETIFRPEDIEAVLPTFPVQDGVLFQALVSPSHYIQHFVYRIERHVTTDDLHRAWSEVISRHPILRTAFVVEDTPLQVVLKPEAVYVPLSLHQPTVHFNQDSFTSWFRTTRMSQIAVEINEDLTTPAFRINVYDAGDKFMVVSLSHAIYDGIAVPSLMVDVDAAVAGKLSRGDERLQPILDAIEMAQDTAYDFWTEKLQHINSKFLAVHHQPAISKAQHIRRVFSTFSYESLQSICRSKHTTIQALGCASFALAGSDHFGWQENALFGVIRSGRSLPVDKVESAVVPLVSLVPFTLSMHGKSTSDLLRDSQSELMSSSAYEHTSLGRIQRWLGVQSLFNTLFSCRIEEPRRPYMSFSHLQTDSPPPEFNLAVEMLADPASNTVELNAAFMDNMSAADMVDFLSRMESCVELFSKQESTIHPSSSTEVLATPVVPVDSIDSRQPNKVDPELEKTLTGTVVQFLNVESSLVGSSSSLVALGLTSLKSVTLSRKLKDSNIFVSAVDIIQADTVRGIASKCGLGSGSGPSKRTSEGQHWVDSLHLKLKEELIVDSMQLTPEDHPQILCATALQAGMLSQTIGSSNRLYVHGFTFKLRHGTSIERLKFTWERIIEETSILRTSFAFAENQGHWAQIVHSKSDLPWSFRSFGDPSTALAEFISTLPFQDVEDFARPPIHLCHFEFNNHDYVLVVLHHALYDGISLPLLFNRVRSIYQGEIIPPSVSFHELVPEILAQEHSGVSYWIKQLEGIHPLSFPQAVDATEGAWRGEASCEAELSDIYRTCRRYQVNVQCLGQAAMAKILSKLSGRNDVVFGQVISGRMLPGAENVIGPVFNTIPCRVDLSASRSYGDLLRKIQRWNNESLSYQHASLRSIQRELGVKSLTDALFLFQPDVAIGNTEFTSIWDSLESASKNETKAQYGLNIELYQNASGFAIRASCRANVMNRATLVGLLAEFSEELRKIILLPASPIFDAPLSIPITSGSNRNSAVSQRLNGHVEQANANDSGFEGWSSAQLTFRDILVAFTKVPSAAVQPSSQLASLGLDSISAIQLAGLAKRAGIRLSATDVAGSTTLSDIAAIIANRSDTSKLQAADTPAAHPLLDENIVNAARSAMPASLRNTIEDILPTTPGMDFMLSSWIRSGGWRFQHVFAFKISPGANVSKLRFGWDKLAERYAILRSVFVNANGRNVLCVLKPGSIQAPWTNVIPDGERSDVEEVGRVVKCLVANPPQLRGGPAAGATYLHGKESDYLVLNMHHALYDAWSFNILIRDLEDIYQGRPLTSRNDLAYLARAIASPENRDQQRAYWQNALNGFRSSIVESVSTQAMAETPSLLLNGKDEAHIPVILPQVARMHGIFRNLVPEFSALQARAAERNLPLHMVLLACWAKAQAKHSNKGNQGVVFGLVHSGRGLDGAEDIGAPCINMLPVYIRNVLGDDTFVVAEQLRADLKLRSPALEQSRLQDVSAWIGAPGKPLFHYFVNLLRVPSPAEGSKPSTGILERIKVSADSGSVRTSGAGGPFQVSSKPPFPVIAEVLDDCMVEIFFDSKKDSIGMEISCQRSVMSGNEARELAESWAWEVRNAFDPSTVC